MTVRTCKPLLLDRLQTRICMKRIKTYHSLRIFFFFWCCTTQKREEEKRNKIQCGSSECIEGWRWNGEKKRERERKKEWAADVVFITISFVLHIPFHCTASCHRLDRPNERTQKCKCKYQHGAFQEDKTKSSLQ